MSNFKDLTGQKFNRLTVIKRVKNDARGQAFWLCECECGNFKKVSSHSLTHNLVKSCGCLHIEQAKISGSRRKHGLSKSSLYSRWRGVKRRCFDKNIENYHCYGGRGITMCEEWKTFKNFYDWAIENGYREDLTLDRIDVNGNYCPQNCRWVTAKVQSNNRRDNHFITYNNETHTIADWARKLNINLMTLNTRLNRNWSIERALTTPINYKNNKKGVAL